MTTSPTPAPESATPRTDAAWNAARVKELEDELVRAKSKNNGDSNRSDAWLTVSKMFTTSAPIGKNYAQHICDEITALRTHCAELEADGRRLDWLERRVWRIDLMHGTPKWKWHLAYDNNAERCCNSTLRSEIDMAQGIAVIDSAMNATRPPEGAKSSP